MHSRRQGEHTTVLPDARASHKSPLDLPVQSYSRLRFLQEAAPMLGYHAAQFDNAPNQRTHIHTHINIHKIIHLYIYIYLYLFIYMYMPMGWRQ